MVSPRWARKRSATVTGSEVASRTTPARSSRTPSRTTPRSVSGPACSQSEEAPPARSARASAFSCASSDPRSSTRTSRPPGEVGRAWSSVASVRSGVPSGVTPDPVEGRAGERGPHGVVRVALAEPAGLAQHPGGGLLPVGPGRGRTGQRERERALVGLELGGLRQAALQGILRGHDSHSRSGRRSTDQHAVRYLAPPWESGPVTSLTDAELAVAAATAGAAEVRSRYGRPVTRHAKEGTDFATSADLASEEAIRRSSPSTGRRTRWSARRAAGPARRRDPRVAGRPVVRHPQLRRDHAARRGQRRAARGRPGAGGGQRRPDQRRGLLDRRQGSPRTSRRCRHAPWRRIPCRCWSTSTSTTPGRRRPPPARGRDVPARLQPAGRLDARSR